MDNNINSGSKPDTDEPGGNSSGLSDIEEYEEDGADGILDDDTALLSDIEESEDESGGNGVLEDIETAPAVPQGIFPVSRVYEETRDIEYGGIYIGSQNPLENGSQDGFPVACPDDGAAGNDLTEIDDDETGLEAYEPMTIAEKITFNAFEVVSILISSICIITFMFCFLFRPVGVSGQSMEPTLEEGNWLLVATYYSTPKYKDIVIITQENEFNEPLVKRVIAVGGQKVNIDFDTGIVYVDDVALNEPYTNTLTKRHVSQEKEFPLYVPYGYVFVMGDNRDNSTDSRSNMVGFIREEYILGKAILRFIPIKKMGFVH